ncbi:MAG: TIGR03560 family F420-dependent LLM class oxidoreductase [Armatimonadetes bacterium]|nr:TIGR03560 family F420-dependent LLM class oxidoreductase [Armatimonadota bacterium]
MDVAIMIEGQNGLTWSRWQRLAAAVEDLRFAALYRSDHFTNMNPPDKPSLELWVSLTWLAGHTRRIPFGPLVTPMSFRHPVMTARMATAVDDLSGGRLTLGVGAGWQQREHTSYGFDLLDMRGRFARLEEALRIITHLLQRDDPLTFHGTYYRLQDAMLLPRPQRPGGPPILIGGNGLRRTLPLAARFAREWNAVFAPPEKFAELSACLDALAQKHGRNPGEIRRSLMTGLVFGRDDQQVQQRLAGRDVAQLRQRGVMVGTPSQVVDQVGPLAEAGVQRVMLQWLELDDLDGLELLAQTLLPQVPR